MTTKRQRDDDDAGFRGAHVHLTLHTPARDYTILANLVLRGQFARPDGTPVRLKAGPRTALYALLSYGVDQADPAWRLDMDRFAGLFVESKDTVYGWIRTLTDEGFVVRERRNDPASGHFQWHLEVSDTPAAIATVTSVNPQVATIGGFSGDGVAPPVDNSDNPSSHHPVVFQGWEKPVRENPQLATSYREVSSSGYVPASSSVSDARENAGMAAEDRPFATAGPPRLVSATSRPTVDEQGRAPDDQWLSFVGVLVQASQCRGKLMPTRQSQDLIAIRLGIAADKLGWTVDQLRNLLLASLDEVDNLAGVWLWRLHPENLPRVPGRPLDPGARNRGDWVTPSAARRAEIRNLAGFGRGRRWQTLMGGGAG